MNVVIIDFDHIFSNSISSYFTKFGNINILETFHTGFDALNFFQNPHPEVNFILFDFSTPNIDFNTLISNIPKGCKLIAFSSENSILHKYINFPYLHRVFQKPIACSTIFNYLVFLDETLTAVDLKKHIRKILAEAGFNVNHAGTAYLVEGLFFSLKSKIKKMVDIYNYISQTFHTDPKLINWSINNAINSAIKQNDNLHSFFHVPQNQKVSAKYIFNYFSNSNFSL